MEINLTGQVSFIRIYFINGLFGMTAVDGAIRQIVGIMYGGVILVVRTKP